MRGTGVTAVHASSWTKPNPLADLRSQECRRDGESGRGGVGKFDARMKRDGLKSEWQGFHGVVMLLHVAPILLRPQAFPPAVGAAALVSPLAYPFEDE